MTRERRDAMALELLRALRRTREARVACERGEVGARERYERARSVMEALTDAAELELTFGAAPAVPA